MHPGGFLWPISSLRLIQSNFWGQTKNFIANLNLFSIDNFDVKKGFLIVIIAPIIEELLKTYGFIKFEFDVTYGKSHWDVIGETGVLEPSTEI